MACAKTRVRALLMWNGSLVIESRDFENVR